MIALEVTGAVLLLILAVAATWMMLVGLLGAIGAVRLKRCRTCGHLLTGGSGRSSGLCPYCRHPWLVRHVMPVHLRHLLPEEMVPDHPRPLDATKPAAS